MELSQHFGLEIFKTCIFSYSKAFFLFQVLAPLHVKSVERPSNTSITWRSTGDYTPGRSRSSARNVASASVTQGRTASTWTTATSTVNRSERTASAPPKACGACNVQLDYKLLSFILIRDQSPMNYDAIFVKWKFDMIFALSLGNFFCPQFYNEIYYFLFHGDTNTMWNLLLVFWVTSTISDKNMQCGRSLNSDVLLI